MRIVQMISVATVLSAAVVSGQTPDFSGTWKLDEARSRVSAKTRLVGLSGTEAPPTLHVMQPKNGTLVVESHIRQSQARLYIPDGKTSTPVLIGEVGTITMTSRWEGLTLASEGTREFSSRPPMEVTEVYGLSADGRTLEVEVTIADGDDKSTSLMRYTRASTLGPCESWPTPCKERPPPNP